MVTRSSIDKETNIIVLLKSLGGLDNARLRPSDIADGEQLDCPPILVWNYIKEDPKVLQLIADAVKDYPWKNRWVLETRRNKWLLYPERIRDVNIELELGPNIKDTAIVWLMNNDPGFGQRTNRDLRKFTEYFKIVVDEYLEKKCSK